MNGEDQNNNTNNTGEGGGGLPLKSNDDDKFFNRRLVYDEIITLKDGYIGDWKDASGRLWSLIGASISIFSTSLMTSIAFGLFYQVTTDGQIGIAASLASGGLTGVIQAVFGGNPMTLCGQTGPVSLIYSFVYRFASASNVPFLPWIAWIGIWTCILHILTGYLGLCRHRLVITPFTGQIFEMLVASDFITTGGKNLVKEFRTTSDSRLNGVFSLLFAVTYITMALYFQGAKYWSFTSRTFTKLITRFSSFAALIICVFFSWIPDWSTSSWPTDVPQRPVMNVGWGQPGLPTNIVSQMAQVETWAIFAAIIPAITVTVLFYVDHNISSMAAYGEEFHFQKPTRYEYDFCVLGVSALICGLLGLPASSGLIPQNPMHSKLCVRQDKTGVPRIIDQRLSPLLHSLLLLLVLLLLPMVEWIPTCLIWGFFFVLASEAFTAHNEFFCRLMFLCSSKRMIEHKWNFVFLDVVPFPTITKFTLIQAICFIMVYLLAVGITLFASEDAYWPVIGVGFPILIMFFAVPLRKNWMPKWFLKEALYVLDNTSLLVRDDIDTGHITDDEFEPDYEGRGAQTTKRVISMNEADIMLSRACIEEQHRFAIRTHANMRIRNAQNKHIFRTHNSL